MNETIRIMSIKNYVDYNLWSCIQQGHIMLAINQSLLIIVVYLLFQESFTKENDEQNPDYLENDDAAQGVIFYKIKI